MNSNPTEIKADELSKYRTDVKADELAKQNLQLKSFWMKIESELSNQKFNKDNQRLNISKMEEILKSELNAINLNTAISPDALNILSKACEIFILDLTMRSWQTMNNDGTNNVKIEDVSRAIQLSELHDVFIA